MFVCMSFWHVCPLWAALCHRPNCQTNTIIDRRVSFNGKYKSKVGCCLCGIRSLLPYMTSLFFSFPRRASCVFPTPPFHARWRPFFLPFPPSFFPLVCGTCKDPNSLDRWSVFLCFGRRRFHNTPVVLIYIYKTHVRRVNKQHGFYVTNKKKCRGLLHSSTRC